MSVTTELVNISIFVFFLRRTSTTLLDPWTGQGLKTEPSRSTPLVMVITAATGWV